MEKYYFEIDAELNCKEECEYSKHIECGEVIDIKIGSLLCKECEHNVSYCGDENWIKCEVYSAFVEIELLKKENEKLKAEILKLKTEVLKSEVEIFDMKGGE